MSRYVGETPEEQRVIENAEQIAEHTENYYDNRKVMAGITAAGVALATLGLAEYLIESDPVAGSQMLQYGTLAIIGGAFCWAFQKLTFQRNISQVQ